MSKVNILLVGGHDPTGGAGIVVDVKTVRALGCNPLTVITSLIPQNNRRVYSKLDIPGDVLEDQLQAILEEFEVSTVKTGVLTKEAIEVLLKYQEEYNFKIVCDPVLKSTTGYNFIDEETLERYFELFKRSLLILPNSQEYRVIKESRYFRDLEKSDLYILVTGIEDTLIYRGKVVRRFRGRRIEKEVHGTGCVFASAVASLIGKGYNIIEAIEEGKRVVFTSVIYAIKTKYGYNANPLYITREKILRNLYYALHLLREIDLQHLIPEGGTYIGECLPLPRGVEDVVTLRVKEKEVKFGASNTLSKVVVIAHHYHPRIRGAMVIRYSEDILEALERCGFTYAPLDSEGDIKKIFEKYLPDALYFRGEVVVLGEDGVDVAKKVREIYEALG
ncbi:MAG TPA: phosphomethylpyrimidine kinase [Methanothermococcus okinawensis]|uniref:Phosphomethylpyrimidine kinase n=1 Tax=Methanothermococcus okinawensis TaxID=155863 RepID=A0A833EDI2_9EURY|nr:phosphomethylpyrimidine kinase [Methanothermococcus okinawensis]